MGILFDIDIGYGYNFGSSYIVFFLSGWEKRVDVVIGKFYFIDYNIKIIIWSYSCFDKLWKRFDMRFEEFKRLIILFFVFELVDFFL